jgi:MoaD family protein
LVLLLVTVRVPVALLQYTRNESELRIDAYTVEELLRNLDTRFPGFRAFIVDEGGRLRRYVSIFVEEEDIRSGDGLMTKLKEGDRVSIVPIVAGG